ncbi:restriction endonuclease subunit S [Lactobacillus jensenii]|uniref:restriction endonuclease subunit S n=1 Tax=Lactobacillus jensenii TaxID=109790 RepID=UPI0012471D4E|nr:restriction endonuclease subunit S [Lactobacillus jensenii]KAA9263328.1 restriction endonuclease subunit S [Lactobacillus jensenii]KAA9319989.1 restriction endonuclease subunit S [Lactobacillus jensenii]MBQ4670025.1 restriction endonuclease subunit S [Lactobacillus jensenii]MBW8449195.1 restriction endonuclease subunit S [Lactobacillus jensenii]MDX5095034.1 restriction endonuclease subunit S [Lactobacillus jensenii]
MYPKVRFRGFDEPWKKVKLGEIATTYSGGTPKAGNKKYYNGLIPFIRSGEIHSNKTELFISEAGLKNSSAKMVTKGDLLYALYGATSGEVDISKINGAINQAVLAIIPKQYNPYIISLLLSKKKDAILSKYLQGGQGNLSAEIVKSIKLILPSKNEESSLYPLFKVLDNLLSLQQRKLELISALEKGLGQIIKQQNNKYGITFSLNNFLEIPPQIQARIKNKNQLLTVKLNLQGLARGVQRDTLSLGSTKYFIRHTGELIFGKQNIFNGSIALITKEFDGLATSNDVPSLKISNINPQFLFYLLKNPDFWKHTELIATGTGSKRVHIHDLLKLHIKIIPDAKYQAKIVSLSRNFEKIVLNQQIIVKECEKTKQFLLQNLFI